MAKYKFTATHGVLLDDIGAHFMRDREAVEVVYLFETDDAKQAEALRNVDDYGIAEVKAAAPKAAEDKPAAAKTAAAK